ncbi:MAG: hypothetical protein IJ262_08475 [Clostridia bacterium]|nr:hypothetical protein [Clostridia bacterium]
MKKFFSLLLCAIVLLTCCVCQTSAANEEEIAPYVIDFSLTAPLYEDENQSAETRASGLILSYGIRLSVTGTTLKILAETICNPEIVKSGFKNFVVQRKKSSSSTWSDYYDYGNLYSESYAATVNTTLAVASGYEYRVTCKHYAKKNLFSTQSISNVSDVVTV